MPPKGPGRPKKPTIEIPPGTDLLRGYVAPTGDPYDRPKLDTLADEPKMWQEGDPIPKSGIIKKETKAVGMMFTDSHGRITKVITADPRKVVNPDSPRTKQKVEPEEGSNAFFLKYGVYYKKDIPKE